MSTLRVLTVSVKAGACSGGSSWSAAFYLQILAQNGSCEMPACISNAQARTKCLVLSFIVLHVRSIRCIRRGDHCSVVFCFVHLVLSSMYLVYSIQMSCVLHPCVESLRLREMSCKAMRSIRGIRGPVLSCFVRLVFSFYILH